MEEPVTSKETPITLLLVDDEDAFRQAASTTLSRRGYEVWEAESGERALALIREAPPQIVVLDLKMGGMDGISTLSELRKLEPDLPVIILTGHGSAESAFAGIRLGITDFLNKPVDMERLSSRIHALLARGRQAPLREKSIPEILIPPSSFQRVYEDEPLESVVRALQRSVLSTEAATVTERGHRTVLVYSRAEKFVGVIRIDDVVRMVIPTYLRMPQSIYLTGMFMAELKIFGGQSAGDAVAPQASVSQDAPLMEAVHLLISRRLTSVTVMNGSELVGLVTDRAIFQEIADSVLGPGGAAPSGS